MNKLRFTLAAAALGAALTACGGSPTAVPARAAAPRAADTITSDSTVTPPPPSDRGGQLFGSGG